MLAGRPGAYELQGDITNVEVPATLQATIGARIDRLHPGAKKTLNAAAVVGMRFDADLLSSLIDDADVTSLIDAQLVDQVRFAPRVEYSFRHPLIRTVAYESQLKSDRTAASTTGVGDRIACLGRRERGADRRTLGGGRRPSRCLRLAHACRDLVDLAQHRVRTVELGQSTAGRRSTGRQ